jgi:hypothetical protein
VITDRDRRHRQEPNRASLPLFASSGDCGHDPHDTRWPPSR